MHCAEFQESLFEWLEGRLDAAEVKRMRSHAAGCPRCRELEELATGDAGLPAVEPPDELVASILAQTTGGACDRALHLVCERFDEGAKAVAEATAADPLLEMHLDSCAECTRLAGALESLRQDLPAMAEMEPETGFIAGVLAATVGPARPEPTLSPARDGALTSGPVGIPWTMPDWCGWVESLPLAARVSAFWERLSQRPRLAFEGAFVGTLALMLVIGLPSAGVADLPSRLMAGVQQERLEVQSAVAENLGRAAEVGRAAWTASTESLGDRLGNYVDTRFRTSSAGSRFADLFERCRVASVEVATLIWDGEFGATFARIWLLWSELWIGADTDGATPANQGNTEETPLRQDENVRSWS